MEAALLRKLAPYIIAALVVLGLVGWAGYERMGRLAALNHVVKLQGDLNLSQELQRETGRAVTALGRATDAATARAGLLEEQRKVQNAPLVASIARLEAKLAAKAPQGADCKQALDEARQEGK